MGLETGVTIEEAIKNSRIYAKRGDKLAKDSIKLVKNASSAIIKKLDSTIQELDEKNVNSSNGVELLKSQLDEIKKEISVLPDRMLDNIKCISQKTINITLFGRTMTGKSTLMEILTHGNGEAIGKGYQRTTRDVREYSYKGLVITDVPGIAAFEGKEDEEVAYDAAKKADLVLFLITDDGPQYSEAVCLKKILNLGKPVICLINVKANIDKNTSIKIFARDLSKKMANKRLMSLKSQFLSFGVSYGQAWDMLTFEYVHLKSAYLSQAPDWNGDNEELYRLSRFEYVEKLIADEVIKNGGYYKIKAYIDTVSVPLMTTADALIKNASKNHERSVIIEEKRDKFESWLKKFKERGKTHIEKSLDILKNDIKREIPIFSETHYSDRNAGKEWDKVVKRFKIDERCGEILDQLAKECEEKLIEIYREIEAELKYSSKVSLESDIHMSSIVDGKKIWDWGVVITTGVLTIISFSVPVVGWVALGVGVVGGLISLLFKSKEEKIKEARGKLENKINENLDKQFKELNKQMKKIFEEELIIKQVDPSSALFNDTINTLKSVSKEQDSFAHSLYDKKEEVDRIMIEEAAAYMGISSLRNIISHISRIPGTCISLCANYIFPEELHKNLESLLKEMVFVVEHVEDFNAQISRMIGVEKNRIKIEYDSSRNPIGIRVDIDEVIDPVMVNRIKMAQQLSRLYISR